MSREHWTAVDRYIADRLVGPDAALDGALEASAAAGLPPIAVSPSQGKLLHLLARALGARTILELGTLGGYSTIWLARALAHDGRLVTLEADRSYAQVARANIARAGLSEIVELRVGRALDTLPGLAAEEPDGALIDPGDEDPAVQGARRFHELLASDRSGAQRVSATTIQTVGSKGYDGFTLALVTNPSAAEK
jgi:predicted O-methyltransferase YrrM